MATEKTFQKPLYQTHIDNLSHEFRGISRTMDKTTFIRGALPGEDVHFYYTKKHRKYHEGQALEIIIPSPDRVESNCPHYTLCGGCSLQHLHHDSQITAKENVLFEQLKHAQLEPQKRLTPITGPIWGYRHKARLGVRYVFKKERLLIGFREHQGRYLADLSTCLTLHPNVGKRLPELAKLISQLSIYQHIPQIEVAIGDDETALIFRHLEPFTKNDLNLLLEYGRQHNLHLYLQPGKPDTIHRITPQTGNNRLRYRLPAFDLELLFHPTDFTQINPAINRQMVSQAIALLDPQPHETVLDLFCGLGNFTLPLAKFAQHVTGIEGNEQMVKRVHENAAHNDIPNVNCFAADLSTDISNAPWANKSYDKLLIDPPRSGALEIIQCIKQLNPKRIVYISCNPATLVRDAAALVKEHGYQLSFAGTLDMFPHTHHIESMAVFDQKN